MTAPNRSDSNVVGLDCAVGECQSCGHERRLVNMGWCADCLVAKLLETGSFI